MTHKYLRSLFAVLLAVLLFNSTSTLACGPFLIEAVFVHTVHPTYPVERFAAGRVGVLQPSYARSYLYVGYRFLNGSGFTPAEQRAFRWRACSCSISDAGPRFVADRHCASWDCSDHGGNVDALRFDP